MEELPVDIAEVRWYENEPTYQVVFWKKLNDPEPPLRPMWWSDSTRLAGVKNIYEVLDWATAHAAGRDITIYAELDRGKQHGTIRLLGVDPTEGDQHEPDRRCGFRQAVCDIQAKATLAQPTCVSASRTGMRVKCIRLMETSGPERGEPLDEHPHLSIGDEFTVLSILLDPMAQEPWTLGIQISDGPGTPTWWPAAMFATVSGDIPSNWTVELWEDGSLHLAPKDWLRPGFWERCFDGDADAVAAFRREREVILREAETG